MMIPITRKEKYINEIVGGGKTAPETPQTREELFFAGILGEVVAPSPITRAEKYLAKIANKYSGELPEPVTRVERFIARAAGMDVTIPTPITREEMFWADYALIVEKKISGVPPLTFNAIAGTLKNYRIYGNTVGGESVGDLVESGENAEEYKVPVTVEGKNLLQNIATSQTINGVTFTVNGDKSVTIFGELTSNNATFVVANSSGIPGRFDHSSAIISEGLMIISTTTNDSIQLRAQYTDDTYKGIITNGVPFTILKDIGMVYIQVTESLPEPVTIYPMIRKAYIEDDTYEPYRTPVTTSIYLSEQIRKVGGEAEYIDFEGQKMAKKSKTITFTSSNGWSTEDNNSFYTDLPLDGALALNYVLENSMNIPSVYVTLVDTKAAGVDANIWVSSTGRLNVYLTTISHTLEALGQLFENTPLTITYELANMNELDITIPALHTLSGTNTLAVGTEVQPSNVYIKYEGAR